MAKILIVDDTPIVRQSTALVLQSYPGWEIDEASSGVEALAKIKSSSYSALLMDYNMPGMNGLECATKIREFERGDGTHTPIICMTASSDRNIKEACLTAGMVDYLEKDCSSEELKMTVLKWVQLKTDSSHLTVSGINAAIADSVKGPMQTLSAT